MSLLEVLVAIAILAIVLGALARGLIASLQATVEQEARIESTAAANAVLEDVRVVDFERAAHCQDDAEAKFGLALVDDGRPVVTEPLGSPTCLDPLLPEECYPRGGGAMYAPAPGCNDGDYFVERSLTWVDDPADGEASLGTDAQPLDYKQLEVVLTWQVGGETRTARTVTQRAREAGEEVLTVVATPIRNRLKASSPEGALDQTLVFDLSSTQPLTSVAVQYVDRDGLPAENKPMTGFGAYNWKLQLDNNSSSFRFTNGETVFTFTATTVDGDTVVEEVNVLFLHNLAIAAPSSDVRVIGTDATGNDIDLGRSIWVDNDANDDSVTGDLRTCPFRLEVDVQGVVPSDSVVARWVDLPDGSPEIPRGPTDDQLVPVAPPYTGSDTVTDFGQRFSIAYDAASDFGPGEPSAASGVDIELFLDVSGANNTFTGNPDPVSIGGTAPYEFLVNSIDDNPLPAAGLTC